MEFSTFAMVSMRAFAVLGVLLAAGLAIFGFQIGRAVKTGREFDRFLTVRGLSEREVTATLAIWPVSFTVAADDLPALKEQMAASRRTVQAFLREHQIADDEVSTGLPAISDREDERLRSNAAANLPRYKAVATLVVRSGKVDVVKDAIQHADDLIASGVSLSGNDYGERPQFLYGDINGIKPEMIAEATASARAAAEKFAQDSRAAVGAIRRATQGALEIDDRDPASPEKKILRVVTTVEFFLQ